MRPNFYTLLALEPTSTDWSTIELAIVDKRRQWSRHKNQGTPSQRRKAERFLKLIPEMSLLLKDPQRAAQECNAHQQEQQKAQQAQHQQLDALINTIHTTTASRDLVKILGVQTGKLFTAEQIEDRLRQQGIKPDKGVKRKKIARPKLDVSLAKTIKDELDGLHLDSLYAFLSLAHQPVLTVRSSCESLHQRADQLYKSLSRLGKTDADTSAKMRLAGHAKSVFANVGNKARYDNSLAAQLLKGLDPYLAIAGVDQFIQSREMTSLLMVGKRFGVTNTAVLEYIEAYAAQKQWGIQQQLGKTRVRLPLCGYCDTWATSAVDKHCNHCGEALVQPCPKCTKPTATEKAACRHCGCHIGDAALVKSLLSEGQLQAAKGDFDAAVNLYDRALHYWPDWAELLSQKQQAQQQKQRRFEALNEIKSLLKTNQLETAEAKMNDYCHRFGLSCDESSIEVVRVPINEGLAKARSAYDTAQKFLLKGKADKAFGQYQAALIHCADFTQAMAAMAKIPEPPSSAVSARWLLDWSMAKARGFLGD
ncbi:MAG: tetratricopeptide (TPR) repeat protein [Phenylobacterium sp.]|jgi:tetratricopeptide (TPR) repeat protein